jgi:hypothetical protein
LQMVKSIEKVMEVDRVLVDPGIAMDILKVISHEICLCSFTCWSSRACHLGRGCGSGLA